jgi:hypothetical protein
LDLEDGEVYVLEKFGLAKGLGLLFLGNWWDLFRLNWWVMV